MVSLATLKSHDFKQLNCFPPRVWGPVNMVSGNQDNLPNESPWLSKLFTYACKSLKNAAYLIWQKPGSVYQCPLFTGKLSGPWYIIEKTFTPLTRILASRGLYCKVQAENIWKLKSFLRSAKWTLKIQPSSVHFIPSPLYPPQPSKIFRPLAICCKQYRVSVLFL